MYAKKDIHRSAGPWETTMPRQARTVTPFAPTRKVLKETFHEQAPNPLHDHLPIHPSYP